VAPAIAARRRTPTKRLAGTDGNQARLRRLVVRRQTPEDPIPQPDLNNPPEPAPKPWIPLGPDWKLDPSVSHPDAPHPWDKPGAGGGAGGSLEDVHKGWNKLFGPKPGLPPLAPVQAPPCSVLMQFADFNTYDNTRKFFHGPLDKEPWPQLTRDQFNQALADCKAKAAPPTQQPPQQQKPSLPPAQPVPDPMLPPLPKGQAYA
jgi:hypothetical protein